MRHPAARPLLLVLLLWQLSPSLPAAHFASAVTPTVFHDRLGVVVPATDGRVVWEGRVASNGHGVTFDLPACLVVGVGLDAGTALADEAAATSTIGGVNSASRSSGGLDSAVLDGEVARRVGPAPSRQVNVTIHDGYVGDAGKARIQPGSLWTVTLGLAAPAVLYRTAPGLRTYTLPVDLGGLQAGEGSEELRLW
jgi:hypothetical protein